MENGFNPLSLRNWMAETFHDQNLDEAVVLNCDGTITTESSHIALGSARNRAFFRQVSSYVERQKTALVSHFRNTPNISREIRKLEEYSVVLCDKRVILKRDLFSGQLCSLPTTLLSSPVQAVFQLKDNVFDSVIALRSGSELSENLEAFYNCLYELYQNRLIAIKGFYAILTELSSDIDARFNSAKDGCSSNSRGHVHKFIERFVQCKKYDLVVLKLMEFDQNVFDLLSVHGGELYRVLGQLAEDLIQKIINDDAQAIEDGLSCVHSVKDSRTTDVRACEEEFVRRLRLTKRTKTDTPATSIAEQKRQFRVKPGAKQEKVSFPERRPTNSVASQCYLADNLVYLNRVCMQLGLDPFRTRQILDLDYENMDAGVLMYVLKNQVGLNDHYAHLILEVVKSPEDIAPLMDHGSGCDEQMLPANSCIQEHLPCEQAMVPIFPDEFSAPLAVEENLLGIQAFNVDELMSGAPVPASTDEAQCDPETVQHLLGDILIEAVGKEHPGEIDAYANIIREHIGSVPLTPRQAYKVMRGHRQTINYAVKCCYVRATGLWKWGVSPQVSAPPVLPAIDTSALQIGSTTRVLGDVALRVRAGIQASDNNCGLAAFFMSISNNGLLNQLIEDAENRLAVLQSLNDLQADPLSCLIDLLRHFNLCGDLDKFILNAGLDNIRLRYRLRAARVNPDAIADAAHAKKEKTVTLTVASDFHRGADLNASNRDASVTFDFLEDDAEHRAVISKLPEQSSGCMMIRGSALNVGDVHTIADLQETEFIPLGEVLEPIEFIPPILNEIYDFNTTDSEQLTSFAMWQKSTTSFKQKVSIVEVQSDCQTEQVDSLPSKQFSETIEGENVPADFILDLNQTVGNPHPFLENVIGAVVDHYFQGDVLRLKLTRDLHHSSRHETRKTYEFYDENGMFEKKVICELERYFADESITFIRAKETEFIDEQGERKRVEQRMSGYSADRPDNGDMKIRLMHRARNFQELLNIFIESWKDRFAGSDDAERARLALLPDEQRSPEVIFMTIPNEGKDQRCDFDWQTGVDLPMADSEQRISYDVSAVMSIQDSHYLSWLRQPEAGLIHCADSMGDFHPQLGPVPTVVTLPVQDGPAKLQAASNVSSGADSYLLASVRGKLLSLGQQAALVILKKKS